MNELNIPQHWGNGRTYHRCEDVRTEDDYETVVVQLRDSEGYRYGTARMTREAALELAQYLIEAARLKETVMERRRSARRKPAWPIDATPALEARAMGAEMLMMAIPTERGFYRNNRTAWDNIRLRAQAMKVVERMVSVYMSREEAGYWTPEEIKDLLASLPTDTVDAFTALPSEDIEYFFRACVDEIRSVQSQIDGLEQQAA